MAHSIFSAGRPTENVNNQRERAGPGRPILAAVILRVCDRVRITTLIEYGKTLGTTESGDIYLNMLDISESLNVRFYAFGNGDKKLDVIDAHIVPRDLTRADCKGDTHMDLETRLCTQKCHEDCDPLHGKQKLSRDENIISISYQLDKFAKHACLYE